MGARRPATCVCARVVALAILLAAAAASARPPVSRCAITSTPSHARVFVDGSKRAAGSTPLVLVLRRTHHAITVEAKGYDSKTTIVTVGARCRIHVALERAAPAEPAEPTEPAQPAEPASPPEPSPVTPPPPNATPAAPPPANATPAAPVPAPAPASAAPAPGPAPAAPAAPAPSPPPEPPRVVFHGPPGAGITDMTDYGHTPLTLYGFFQVRDTATRPVGTPGATTNDALAVQRARLLASGYIHSRDITYFLFAGFASGDYLPGTSVALYDTVVTFSHYRDAVVRVGQFAYSLDREQPIPPFLFQFIDRSPVLQELGADEDVGVQVGSNDLFGLGGRVRYKLYAGAGEGRNPSALAPVGFVYAGRVELLPFGKFDTDVEGDFTRSPRPRLAVGIGAAYNQKAQHDHGNFGATYTLGGFDYRSAAADVTFKLAGLSVIAEALVRQSDTRSRTGTGPDGMPRTEYSRSALGYFVQAGYMFPSFVELAARYSRLRALAPTDPALEQSVRAYGHELGGALSWYVLGNHGLKLQADYFYQFGSIAGVARHQARVQLQVSF